MNEHSSCAREMREGSQISRKFPEFGFGRRISQSVPKSLVATGFALMGGHVNGTSGQWGVEFARLA
jgi:hypothetical protein